MQEEDLFTNLRTYAGGAGIRGEFSSLDTWTSAQNQYS